MKTNTGYFVLRKILSEPPYWNKVQLDRERARLINLLLSYRKDKSGLDKLFKKYCNTNIVI